MEHWTCDWKVAGFNPVFEGSCEAISEVSVLSAVPVFQMRHKNESWPYSAEKRFLSLCAEFLKVNMCCLDLLFSEVESHTYANAKQPQCN